MYDGVKNSFYIYGQNVSFGILCDIGQNTKVPQCLIFFTECFPNLLGETHEVNSLKVILKVLKPYKILRLA